MPCPVISLLPKWDRNKSRIVTQLGHPTPDIQSSTTRARSQVANPRDLSAQPTDNTNHRAVRHSNGAALSPDLRERRRAHQRRRGGAEITFSSQARQSAASSAAQKSTAGALSHTSQIVRISTPCSRRPRHRPAAIRATNPRLLLPPPRAAARRSPPSAAAAADGGPGGGERCGRGCGSATEASHTLGWTRRDVAATARASRGRHGGSYYYLIWPFGCGGGGPSRAALPRCWAPRFSSHRSSRRS